MISKIELVNKIRNVLNTISITNKTRILVFILVMGMIIVGVFSHLRVYFIKNDLDRLYIKRTYAVVKLEEIKDIYTVNIFDTLLDIEKKHISPKTSKDVIALAKELIRRNWTEYKEIKYTKVNNAAIETVYKTVDKFVSSDTEVYENFDSDLEDQIEKRIYKVEAILDVINRFFDEGRHEKAFELLSKDLYPSINSINIYLTQLIHHHLDMARYEKKKTDKMYVVTLGISIFIAVVALIFAVFFSLVIITNIRELHYSLEDRIAEKTKELRELNANLEKRVQLEVENSRKKDQIMYQQSRLAAMGEMVGNIAHQWRQPLNALSILIQSFELKHSLGNLNERFIKEQVDEGLRLANSMSNTIDDFRNFFKPNKVKKAFSLQESIDEAVKLVDVYFTKDNIHIGVECKQDFLVYGFGTEFSQVILNMLNNAKDALTQYGTKEKKILVIVNEKKKKDDCCVQIDLIDNGGGIKKDIISRIFEPYFTTKHQMQGTGIGLYMSKQIVESQMQGSIFVENVEHTMGGDKLYMCAKFTIEIPLVQDSSAKKEL